MPPVLGAWDGPPALGALIAPLPLGRGREVHVGSLEGGPAAAAVLDQLQLLIDKPVMGGENDKILLGPSDTLLGDVAAGVNHCE